MHITPKTDSAPESGGPGAPMATSGRGGPGPRAGWFRPDRLDLDRLYQWLTLLILPIYAVWPAIRSLIFVVYAALFILKCRTSGFRKTGLEWFAAAAILGLAASCLGADETGIMRNVWRVARIIALPILMSQFRPIPGLAARLAGVFSGLGAYGLVRMWFFPIIVNTAPDRPYCFSDFHMHSSIIAVSGLFLFLTLLVFQTGRRRKIWSALGVLAYAYLVMAHVVRASYLSVLCLLPLFVAMNLRTGRKRRWLAGLLLFAISIGALYVIQPRLFAYARERAASIVDPQDGSNRGRLVFWSKALQIFARHPVNGIGYKLFNRNHVFLNNREIEFASAFWHCHSEPLGLLAETGLIGFLSWLAFKLKLLSLFLRHRRHWAGTFLFFVLLAFEIHNLFEYYLYERIAYIYVYVLCGLGLNQILGENASPAPGSGAHG